MIKRRAGAKFVRPLMHRVKMMAARGWVTLVDDDRKMQSLQLGLLHDEKKENVERFQQYGFTSNPKPPDDNGEAEALTVFLGGNRDHGITIAVDDRRYRMKGLKSGEVALYDDQGQYVLLKRERIEVVSPLRVDVKCHDVRLGNPDPNEGEPSVASTDPIARVVQKLVDERFKTRFDNHRHDDAGGTGLSGVVTSPDRLVIDEDTTENTRAV